MEDFETSCDFCTPNELVPISLSVSKDKSSQIIVYKCYLCNATKTLICKIGQYDNSEIGNGKRIKEIIKIYKEITDSDIGWFCKAAYPLSSGSVMQIDRINEAILQMQNCRSQCEINSLEISCYDQGYSNELKKLLISRFVKLTKYTDNEWNRAMCITDNSALLNTLSE